MGTCCTGYRPSQTQSVYSIVSDGLSVLEYDLLLDRFFQHKLNTQLPAMCKYCEIVPDKILIVGGYKRLKDKIGGALSDVYLFTKDSGVSRLTDLVSPRTGHCLIPVYGTAYLISGVFSQIEPTASCLKYDYFLDTWTDIAPISKPRVLAAGCYLNGFLYITGGNPGNSLQNYRDIERYNISGNSWNTVLVKLPVDLWRHTCLAYSGGLMVFGGNGNRSHNLDCFKIKLDENVITQNTLLGQGGEFTGCNIIEKGVIYAFESTHCKVVWILEIERMKSRVKRNN